MSTDGVAVQRRAPQGARRLVAPLLARRNWVATLYLLQSLVLGPVWFVVLAWGLIGGIATAWTPIGLPVAAGAVALARQGAILERERARLIGVTIAEPYRIVPAGSWGARLRGAAADPATWRDLVYLLLLFPVGLVAGLVPAAWVAVAAGLTLPLWYRAAPPVPGGVALDSAAEVLAAVTAAALLALALPPIARGAAVAHGVLARALLGPTAAALRARVRILADSRARAVDVAATERRRIERLLHDGAQQRLVALAMDLGMAREKFDRDPAEARALIEEAHDEAKRALAELRDLARGIHPAVLTDRGLDAAVSALAGRSPVPVQVEVDLDRRLPPDVESVAYFVIAEALTNIARHSAAMRARVRVRREPGTAIVEVTDDGVGGATMDGGTGLRGLADRAASIEGRLTLDSPEGGPTTVRAELPCA